MATLQTVLDFRIVEGALEEATISSIQYVQRLRRKIILRKIYMGRPRTYSTIEFNHIDYRLSENEINKLQDHYKHYHGLFTCYHWIYKRLRQSE